MADTNSPLLVTSGRAVGYMAKGRGMLTTVSMPRGTKGWRVFTGTDHPAGGGVELARGLIYAEALQRACTAARMALGLPVTSRCEAATRKLLEGLAQ